MRGFRIGLGLGLFVWLLIIAAGVVVARAADSTCGDIPMPPAQYDHVPKGTTIVATADLGQVGRMCALMGMGVQTLTGSDSLTQGCSWQTGALGHVLIADDFDAKQSECAVRHEYGHLNGWPATHPDAHFE